MFALSVRNIYYCVLKNYNEEKKHAGLTGRVATQLPHPDFNQLPLHTCTSALGEAGAATLADPVAAPVLPQG